MSDGSDEAEDWADALRRLGDDSDCEDFSAAAQAAHVCILAPPPVVDSDSDGEDFVAASAEVSGGASSGSVAAPVAVETEDDIHKELAEHLFALPSNSVILSFAGMSSKFNVPENVGMLVSARASRAMGKHRSAICSFIENCIQVCKQSLPAINSRSAAGGAIWQPAVFLRRRLYDSTPSGGLRVNTHLRLADGATVLEPTNVTKAKLLVTESRWRSVFRNIGGGEVRGVQVFGDMVNRLQLLEQGRAQDLDYALRQTELPCDKLIKSILFERSTCV